MKKTIHIVLFFFLLIGIIPVCAGNIQLDFPTFAGKSISISCMYGINEESMFNGKLDDNGQLLVTLSEQYTDFSGMASLRIEDEVILDFIINRENPLLSFNGTSIVFKNSPENENLQKWFTENAFRTEKLAYAFQLLQLYKKGDKLYNPLKQECETLEKEQIKFDSRLENSSLYGAKFLKLHSFLNNEVQPLVYMDSIQMSTVRDYVIEKLDIDALYTSGLWFNILNGLLAMYDTQAPFSDEFIPDMSQLLKRTKNDRAYTALSENLFEICEAMDWQEQSEQLAYFLLNDGRITEPQGKLKLLLATYKLRKGNQAPVLMQGLLSEEKQNILVFYESGCINCNILLEEMKSHYSDLREKNIEIITISADTDQEAYKELPALPWEQKYCDFHGFSGDDFVNYCVIGTPTIFLIDEKGIIKGRYARFRDVELNNVSL